MSDKNLAKSPPNSIGRGVSDPESIGEPNRQLTVARMVPFLVADGLLATADAEQVLRFDGLSSKPEHALVSLANRRLAAADNAKPLDIERLTDWAAGKLAMERARIDPLKVDLSRVAEVMSSQYAARYKILPLEVNDGAVVVATAEPFMSGWVPELEKILRKKIHLVFANPADLSRYIVEFFSLAKSVRDAQKNGSGNATQNFEQLVELGRSGKNLDANDSHIVTIVDWLWEYAFEQRASDIHLEPRRDMGTIRFRIDGVLHHVYQVPASVMTAMVSRIKLLGRMDLVEKRRPQDGRIKTLMDDGQEIELRLSTLPTAFGEKMVMRIFDPDVLVRTFSELGFARDELSRWNEMIARPNGIVLVTGPTGSGKTTTLYSTLKHLATDEVNVCTVEDPIEMVDPALNQMQVQSNIGLNFADGVRALMRQDPDIVMIGEIRDLETAEMATQAALTGHLVLSTLHTNDAPSAVTRLIELGIPSYLLNATLNGVLAQRLVRTLCPACKEPMESVPQEHWEALIHPYQAPAPKQVYRPVGCLECRMTGFRGRAGIYEMLTVDESIQSELARPEPNLERIRRKAMKRGMKPLRLAGAQKIAAGVTTFEEVLKVAPSITHDPRKMASQATSG
ncbi:MAG: GspE/PulE family protein, partial [Burkholderiaceae bacterium]